MKIIEKLTRGYEVEVSDEHWMTVSKTISLYHQLIVGPIFVESREESVKCSFECRLWNVKQVEMMLSALMLQNGGIRVEEL